MNVAAMVNLRRVFIAHSLFSEELKIEGAKRYGLLETIW
jgi:hypothetical protein